MPAGKFKVGYMVVCQDTTATSPPLIKNGVYKVTKVENYGEEHDVLWLDIGAMSPWAYSSDRFKLFNPADSVERPETLVKGTTTSGSAPIFKLKADTTPAPSEVGTGIKHDQDKPDMSLLSSIAILEVAKVMTFGKKKYAAHNWRGGFAWSRPLAAALRHTFAFIGGEDKDPETGLSHLAHAICCLIFVLEFTVTGAGKDDRYKQEPK